MTQAAQSLCQEQIVSNAREGTRHRHGTRSAKGHDELSHTSTPNSTCTYAQSAISIAAASVECESVWRIGDRSTRLRRCAHQHRPTAFASRSAERNSTRPLCSAWRCEQAAHASCWPLRRPPFARAPGPLAPSARRTPQHATAGTDTERVRESARHNGSDEWSARCGRRDQWWRPRWAAWRQESRACTAHTPPTHRTRSHTPTTAADSQFEFTNIYNM